MELRPGAQPVRQKVRPLNPDQRKSLQEQLKVWTDEGVIERTSSPWASPLVPVMKKTGDIRWAVDYRALNGATIADTYPLPSIAESLERLSGAEIFSCLDAASVYNVIPVVVILTSYKFGAKNSERSLLCSVYWKMPRGVRQSVSDHIFRRSVDIHQEATGTHSDLEAGTTDAPGGRDQDQGK